MSYAKPVEDFLLKYLRDRHWVADEFGQALLKPDLRAALQRIRPHSPLRWLPDIAAVYRDNLVFFEAKAESPQHSGSKNVTIEDKASATAWRIVLAFGVPLIYVWMFSNALRAIESNRLQVAPKRPGPQLGKGSGTPYCLMSKLELVDLDDLLAEFEK